MLINIKTSGENKEKIIKLSQKFLGNQERNVIARIALGYSLQTGKKFTQQEFGNYSSKGGQEYKDAQLFNPTYKSLMIALICQFYGIRNGDEKIGKYIKLHIDHGIELIYKQFEDDEKYTIIDFLKNNLEKGISFLESSEVSLDHVKNNNQNIGKDYFTAGLKIPLGKSLNTKEDIFINLNTNLYNNQHIAIAGNSGTGKTQFALHLLKEISDLSNQKINFIYLDFKGLKGDDLKYYEPFFKDTNTTFIDIPHTKFPLNPLSFADNINEINKKMGIEKFADIICKYDKRIGVKQKGNLKEAVRNAFDEKKMGEYPTISEIKEKLLEIVGDKKDSLTEIIESLSEFEVFSENTQKSKSFLNENIYLSLSGDLSESVRFTSLFLIVNYIYNTFMNMDNTPVNEQGFRAMRYIVLIDEAHVLFKEKQYQDILEKILREIRSKGVSIILLSQGINEFNQARFDFSEMCETAFLLDIKDKTNSKAINKFLGLSEKEGIKVARSLEKIEKGQVISNIKEFEKGKLFTLNQFKDRE